MNSAAPMNWNPFKNILYIGDEAKTCITIIEKFNGRLAQIETAYAPWFHNRNVENKPVSHDKLQYHIHYHFEGGIAAFKFRNEDELPAVIRNECFSACRDLASELKFF